MRFVFSNRCACRRVTADTRPDLGPRSLDPDRSFWSAFAELIWSQTPPVDFCNCYDERALSTSSYDPRRDDHLDGLPFLTPLALSLAGAVRRSEPHIVRPIRPRCRFLLVAQVYPTAIPNLARHLVELPRRSCSGDRRARVRGPREGRVDCRTVREVLYDFLTDGACASKSTCGRRSLPQLPPDIRCRWCGAEMGGDPFPT